MSMICLNDWTSNIGGTPCWDILEAKKYDDVTADAFGDIFYGRTSADVDNLLQTVEDGYCLVIVVHSEFTPKIDLSLLTKKFHVTIMTESSLSRSSTLSKQENVEKIARAVLNGRASNSSRFSIAASIADVVQETYGLRAVPQTLYSNKPTLTCSRDCSNTIDFLSLGQGVVETRGSFHVPAVYNHGCYAVGDGITTDYLLLHIGNWDYTRSGITFNDVGVIVDTAFSMELIVGLVDDGYVVAFDTKVFLLDLKYVPGDLSLLCLSESSLSINFQSRLLSSPNVKRRLNVSVQDTRDVSTLPPIPREGYFGEKYKGGEVYQDMTMFCHWTDFDCNNIDEFDLVLEAYKTEQILGDQQPSCVSITKTEISDRVVGGGALNSNTGLIIGIVIGCVVLIVVIVIVIYCIRRRNRTRSSSSSERSVVVVVRRPAPPPVIVEHVTDRVQVVGDSNGNLAIRHQKTVERVVIQP